MVLQQQVFQMNILKEIIDIQVMYLQLYLKKDSSSGNVGTQTIYAKSGHQHQLQFSSNIPVTDSANGSQDSSTDSALSNHSNPINVETNAGNILKPDRKVDNGTPTFYARNDHLHPLNVSVVDPLPDGEATAGLANTYARSDHIHPINVLSNIPIKDTVNKVVGTQTTFARSDHAHPLNVSTALPVKTITAVGSADTQNIYARIDHQHPLQSVTTEIPPVDSGTDGVANQVNYATENHWHPLNTITATPLQHNENGNAGNTTYYDRCNHAHLINVYPNNGSLLKPNFNLSNGTSAYYSRLDHVYLLTVTFPANLSAPDYVKSGVSDLQVLLSDGTSKSLSYFMLV
ncbi:MAG: hypothetical protein EZS28_009446 [Streblomastix strix]|uniref:Uncharacterized protein n=1 Tax=Streblomastix strix TaxID=222440 RepID=A0A5J4WKZ3_9EUKA|nr:MAG: hypothetical protein EZS28_009446 [Streblomastix strix]